MAVLVFAKAPVAGTVKTRLIPLLGAAGAATLQRRLITQALSVARAATPGRIELWCAPDITHPFLQAAASAHVATLHAQQGDDLGKRMAHAFACALRTAKYAICIGADCPALTAQHLQSAMTTLQNGHDAVFVPAEDGGYALIGLARDMPQLFEHITWGGPQVMAQTRARLHALNLRWHELETLWDVDRPEDYRRLLQTGWLDEIPIPS